MEVWDSSVFNGGADLTGLVKYLRRNFVMRSEASQVSRSESVQWRNYTWAIVGNAQVALWTAQNALPSD